MRKENLWVVKVFTVDGDYPVVYEHPKEKAITMYKKIRNAVMSGRRGVEFVDEDGCSAVFWPVNCITTVVMEEK